MIQPDRFLGRPLVPLLKAIGQSCADTIRINSISSRRRNLSKNFGSGAFSSGARARTIANKETKRNIKNNSIYSRISLS